MEKGTVDARRARTSPAGRNRKPPPGPSSAFDYDLDHAALDLRAHPELYRVGRGEQGVLRVEPYKSELLPLWRFRSPAIARESAAALLEAFKRYKAKDDFVGMDMARKYLQMGYTRSRRYANHAGGRKYADDGTLLPLASDPEKAACAAIFKEAWKAVEADPAYAARKERHKREFG